MLKNWKTKLSKKVYWKKKKSQVKQKKAQVKQKRPIETNLFLQKEKAFFWQEEQSLKRRTRGQLLQTKEKPVVEKNIEKENLLKKRLKNTFNELTNKLLQERWVDAQGWARRRTSIKEETCEFAALGVPRGEQIRDMVAQRMVDPSRWRFQFRFAHTVNWYLSPSVTSTCGCIGEASVFRRTVLMSVCCWACCCTSPLKRTWIRSCPLDWCAARWTWPWRGRCCLHSSSSSAFADTEQYFLRPPPSLINWRPSWLITLTYFWTGDDHVRGARQKHQLVWVRGLGRIPRCSVSTPWPCSCPWRTHKLLTRFSVRR